MAGIWKPEPEVNEYLVEEARARETVVVLAGSARIEIRDGPTLDLSTGDLASLPRSVSTTWYTSPALSTLTSRVEATGARRLVRPAPD